MRLATEEDLPAIRDLLRRVYVGERYSDADMFDGFLAQLRLDSRTLAFLAVEDGRSALDGCVFFLRAGSSLGQIAGPGEVEMRLLAVNPDRRGGGAGAALVRACVQQARRDDGDLVLSTQPSMEAAHRLYERLGFERVPSRDWSTAAGRQMRVYLLARASRRNERSSGG